MTETEAPGEERHRPTLSRRLVLRNTAAIMVARAVDIGAGLLTLRLLAPHLGPARYGDYAWAWAFVLAFQPLVNFETDRILIREAARDRERTRALWGAALLIKGTLAVGFVLAVGAAALSMGITPELRTSLLLAMCSELFYHLHMLHSAVFQSRERREADLALMTSFRLTLLAGIVAGVATHRPIPFFFAAAIVANALRTVAGAGLILPRVGAPDFRGVIATAREVMWLAAPLTASSILAGLTLNAEVFLLKALAPAEHVGYFQMANAIVFQLQIVPGALMTALFPGFARTFHADPRRLASFVRQAALVFQLVAGVMALALCGASGVLVRLLGAGKYGPAEPVLATLALAVPGVFAMTLFSFALVAADGQRSLVRGSVVGLATNVLLGLWLVPRLQSTGAAVATGIAYAAMGSAYATLAAARLPGALDAGLVARVLGCLAVAGTVLELTSALPLPLRAGAALAAFLPGSLWLARPALAALPFRRPPR